MRAAGKHSAAPGRAGWGAPGDSWGRGSSLPAVHTLHYAGRKHSTACEKFTRNCIHPLPPAPPPETHTTLHYTPSLTLTGCSDPCKNVQPLFQNPTKKKTQNIFMNQITKTHVPGFRIKQRAGNEWESRQSWPRPFLALLLPSGLLGPKRTFRKSSQCREGPSQSLHPLRGQKHIKKGLQEEGCLHRMPQNPRLCPLTNACQWSEMLIFHAPSPPIHLLQLT